MENKEKIRFAINQISITNCSGSANEYSIKAVRYLQEVHQVLSQDSIGSCSPSHRQIFFALFNVENRDFLSSVTKTHVFTAPLIMDSKIFINSELAEKFIKDNKLRGFSVCRITPKYSFE